MHILGMERPRTIAASLQQQVIPPRWIEENLGAGYGGTVVPKFPLSGFSAVSHVTSLSDGQSQPRGGPEVLR